MEFGWKSIAGLACQVTDPRWKEMNSIESRPGQNHFERCLSMPSFFLCDFASLRDAFLLRRTGSPMKMVSKNRRVMDFD
jgi:hypothetical protein